MAWAGWIGLLVTALNLIPAGQLDGGHLLYVLAGNAADRLRPLLIVGLVGLGFFWPGWWIWALLLFFLGRGHARPYDEITPLDPRRKIAAVFGLILLLLLFTPVPFARL
jgi:membrane-associated protease RseP (regulator of RpoE activity)